MPEIVDDECRIEMPMSYWLKSCEDIDRLVHANIGANGMASGSRHYSRQYIHSNSKTSQTADPLQFASEHGSGT
jgi:hypothetical protein